MKPRNFLFIHQNMPGQFVHLCQHLRDNGHNIVFITQNKINALAGVRKAVYELHRQPDPNVHPYLRSTEAGILHGQAVFKLIEKLKEHKFSPDIVIGHCGWGETMFVKDALPGVPLLNFFEFFYDPNGRDLNFDPEYQSDINSTLSARIKNSINHTSFQAGDWGISPTFWQQNSYPEHFRSKISVIHDGVDTRALQPSPDIKFTLPSGKVLSRGDKVITFVARSLEPYRGFHIFMRAVPEIQRRHPDAEILIIGSEGVSYGKKLPEGDSYKKRMLAEIQVNTAKVHFLGHLNTTLFRAALNVSAAHIYLTYPFVLSWSMLEAMAMKCIVIGSRTAPVEEVIKHGYNGLLVDFFDVKGLSEQISDVLENQKEFDSLRESARATVLARYDLHSVSLPSQTALIFDMIDGRLGK